MLLPNAVSFKSGTADRGQIHGDRMRPSDESMGSILDFGLRIENARRYPSPNPKSKIRNPKCLPAVRYRPIVLCFFTK
jgi:hypothetical protein